MRVLKIIIQGLALSGFLLLGLLLGNGLSTLLLVPSLLMIQLLSSATFALFGYLGFTWLLKKAPAPAVLLSTRKEYTVAYIVSFLWTPVLLIPGMFLFLGKVPTVNEILLVWWFQFPVGYLSAMLTAAVFKAEGIRRVPKNKDY